MYVSKASSLWERIFDFGKGETGPYIFVTRNLRGTCFAGEDLIADPGKSFATDEWVHVSFAVTGTEGGTLSSAGPVMYVNGEVVADGMISQTSSGTYAKLRTWFATFEDQQNYSNNTIGKSQYAADVDFSGYISDFRVYKAGLTQDEVIEIMCESLTDEDIVKLAKDKYLTFPSSIITKDIELPASLMGGKVDVSWVSSDSKVISNEGVVNKGVQSAQGVTLTALLKKGLVQ